MKPMIQFRILMTLAMFSLLLAGNPAMAQVYKVVDENGNVTYTDRPPADGAKPVDLPPLSIIEAPEYEPTARQQALESGSSDDEDEEVPLRTLRRTFRDFAIISPANEESVWNPEQAIPVAWSVSSPLQPGMTVTLSIDGKQQAKTTQSIIPVAGLERGAHTITAELTDARNRRVASAQPVTFFVRQPNIYTNRVRPRG